MNPRDRGLTAENHGVVVTCGLRAAVVYDQVNARNFKCPGLDEVFCAVAEFGHAQMRIAAQFESAADQNRIYFDARGTSEFEVDGEGTFLVRARQYPAAASQ